MSRLSAGRLRSNEHNNKEKIHISFGRQQTSRSKFTCGAQVPKCSYTVSWILKWQCHTCVASTTTGIARYKNYTLLFHNVLQLNAARKCSQAEAYLKHGHYPIHLIALCCQCNVLTIQSVNKANCVTSNTHYPRHLP